MRRVSQQSQARGVPGRHHLYRPRQQLGQSVQDRSHGNRAAVIAKYEGCAARSASSAARVDELRGR